MRYFEKTVANENVLIIQLRSHDLNNFEYLALAEKCLALSKQHQTKLILNQKVKDLKKFEASGLHLTSKRLLATYKRPLNDNFLVSASCHNEGEIHHASKLKLDYIFLGPLLEKDSSPKDILGWEAKNKMHDIIKMMLNDRKNSI